jgi:hypothetical protein
VLKIFGSKVPEITGGWGKFRIENFVICSYSFSNFIRANKSKRTRLERYLACMTTRKKIVQSENLDAICDLREVNKGGRVMLKWVLDK